MPSTLRTIRELVGNRLGGFYRGDVSLAPDITDTLAQRQILAGELYDADRGSKGYANQFVWVGRYRDQRRARENGYRTLAYAVYEPPASGSYTLTMYGFGTTTAIPFDGDADDIELALSGITLGAASVTITSGIVSILLPDVIDTEISNGTMITQGGVGSIEVNRGFTRALTVGDEFEICSKLPFLDADNVQGLNTVINMALRNMWFISDILITPVRNSRGIQTYMNLTDHSWLTSDKQIVAIYNPTYWELTAVFTPPLSGTYTLNVDMGSAVYTTAPLNYDATGNDILSALANLGLTVSFSVTPTALGSPYTIVLNNTRFGEPSISSSAGTVVNTRAMLETPTRALSGWKFQYHGESPYIDNLFGQEGESFIVKAAIPAFYRIAPQAAYGTLGTLWGTSETGLFDDYDQCVPPAEDVAAFAYALACDQMLLIDQTDTFWLREAKKAHVIAAGIKIYDMPYDDKPRGNYYGSASSAWGSKGYWGSW